jgi:hypothetical protein
LVLLNLRPPSSSGLPPGSTSVRTWFSWKSLRRLCQSLDTRYFRPGARGPQSSKTVVPPAGHPNGCPSCPLHTDSQTRLVSYRVSDSSPAVFRLLRFMQIVRHILFHAEYQTCLPRSSVMAQPGHAAAARRSFPVPSSCSCRCSSATMASAGRASTGVTIPPNVSSNRGPWAVLTVTTLQRGCVERRSVGKSHDYSYKPLTS